MTLKSIFAILVLVDGRDSGRGPRVRGRSGDRFDDTGPRQVVSTVGEMSSTDRN